MAAKPESDARQRDFFGAPPVEPKKAPPAKSIPAKPVSAKPPPAQVVNGAEPHGPRVPREQQEEEGLHTRLTRLSPAELRELAAALTDDGLAQLTLASVRQLKRRLMRESRYGNKGQRSPLKRAAEQLVAEFSGQGEEDEF